jgi:hypothetical protein
MNGGIATAFFVFALMRNPASWTTESSQKEKLQIAHQAAPYAHLSDIIYKDKEKSEDGKWTGPVPIKLDT